MTPIRKPQALDEDVFNHDKHYAALVRWMKRKKMNAYDLCDLFAEGSTVAQEIWRLYDAEGWPRPAQTYAERQK
jgi:hypothetical protein